MKTNKHLLNENRNLRRQIARLQRQLVKIQDAPIEKVVGIGRLNSVWDNPRRVQQARASHKRQNDKGCSDMDKLDLVAGRDARERSEETWMSRRLV